MVEQLAGNPFAEICACRKDGSAWIRISAELVAVDDRGIKVKMLEKMPVLKNMYSADDDSMRMYYLKDASAIISSFTAAPEVITF